MLPILTARAAPSGVFLTASATGSAMAMAISKAVTESSICVMRSSAKSGRPSTSSILLTSLCPPPPRPGSQVAFQGQEQQVGHDGEGRRQHRAGDDHGREVT